MSQNTTVAVLSAKDLEADILGSFPGVRVIGFSVIQKVIDSIRNGSVGLVLTKVDHPRQNKLQLVRGLAREAARHDIPTLIVAESADAYTRIRNAVGGEPIVGVAYGRNEVRPLVNLLRDRASRVHAGATTGPATPAVSLDLDGHPLLKATTSFLRNPASGRLDTKRIADFYGESLKRFADALHVSSAAVSQTPDSKKYQDFLSYFEKVARILPLLESKDSFSAWAKTPNKELKGAAPIEWLFGGPKKARLIAETVEEVLVGQPD